MLETDYQNYRPVEPQTSTTKRKGISLPVEKNQETYNSLKPNIGLVKRIIQNSVTQDNFRPLTTSKTMSSTSRPKLSRMYKRKRKTPTTNRTVKSKVSETTSPEGPCIRWVPSVPETSHQIYHQFTVSETTRINRDKTYTYRVPVRTLNLKCTS